MTDADIFERMRVEMGRWREEALMFKAALKRIVDIRPESECPHGAEPDYCDGCARALQARLREAIVAARAVCSGDSRERG